MTDFASEWERCSPWIEAALERGLGSFGIDDLRDAVETGAMQFWPGKKCALISQVQEYPRKKWLHVPFIGGDLEEVKAMEASLASFAKFIGCDGLTGAGRPGWGRAMGGNWRECSRSFVSEF